MSFTFTSRKKSKGFFLFHKSESYVKLILFFLEVRGMTWPLSIFPKLYLLKVYIFFKIYFTYAPLRQFLPFELVTTNRRKKLSNGKLQKKIIMMNLKLFYTDLYVEHIIILWLWLLLLKEAICFSRHAFFCEKKLPQLFVGKCICNGRNEFYAWPHLKTNEFSL